MSVRSFHRLCRSRLRFSRRGAGHRHSSRKVIPAVFVILTGLVASGCQAPSAEAPLRQSETRKKIVAKPTRPKATPQAARVEDALLRAPSVPTSCEDQPLSSEANSPSASLASGKHILTQGKQSDDLANTIRLEYERECYKQSEARVRDQLIKLQSSVRRALSASRRGER